MQIMYFEAWKKHDGQNVYDYFKCGDVPDMQAFHIMEMSRDPIEAFAAFASDSLATSFREWVAARKEHGFRILPRFTSSEDIA